MAGVIAIDGRTWSASFWVFERALRRLCLYLPEPAASTVREVLEEGLEYLSADRFEAEQWEAIRRWLASDLVDNMAITTEEHLPYRDRVLDRYRELAALASGPP